MYTPGPGNHNVPSSIGDFHPTINTSPSARLMGRSWDKKNKRQLHYTPGPNQYDSDNNAFLKSGPSARILGREKQNKTMARDSGPGPGAYFADFYQGAESPAFSFGIRHAPCVVVPSEGDENF
uniref:Outer dense fiber protein 3-B n=1 Tax=Lygus hesperus TaxID=30085 RepID=A0A0A9WG02_LYGHE